MATEQQKFKSVPELKEFLRERGIQTSLYRKEQLIQLAVAASEINLEAESDSFDDKRDSDQLRRTVVIGGYSNVVLPDVGSITGWQSDLSSIPNIEMGDIMVYLMTTCGWGAGRLKSYKEDNSYKLFQNRHIDNVRIGNIEHNYIYVRCTCVPETRQSEKPYETWILLNRNGTIKSGGCTCVA